MKPSLFLRSSVLSLASLLALGCPASSTDDDDSAAADAGNGSPCAVRCPDNPPSTVTCYTFTGGTPVQEVRLVRHTDYEVCAGGCHYVGDGFMVRHAGGTACFTQAADITYSNTHHNWNDSVRACDSSLCFELTMDLHWDVEPMAWEDQLSAFSPDGGVAWGPVPLTATSVVGNR